jgi:hypothetical protein
MTDEQKQALAATIEGLGLTYSARFVPQSQSRNKDEKDPCLNWVVTLGRGRQQIETDYMQGIAHLPGYCHSSANKLIEAEAIHRAAETGKWNPKHDKAGLRAGASWAQMSLEKPIPVPALDAVLYCLVMDANVLNSAGFEDWASEYGYDTDSRSAEATYRGCLEIALKLQAMLGAAGMAKLAEAFQDY